MYVTLLASVAVGERLGIADSVWTWSVGAEVVSDGNNVLPRSTTSPLSG